MVRYAKKVFDHSKETGSLKRIKYKGWHKKVSKSNARHRLQIATQNAHTILTEIIADSQLHISEWTVGNLLWKHLIYVHVAHYKPQLSSSAIKRRRYFRSQYPLMGLQWWQKHVYTNEVYISCSPQQHICSYIIWSPHAACAYQILSVVLTFIPGSKAIGFWGVFTSKGHL